VLEINGDGVVSNEADFVVVGLRVDALRLGLDFALHWPHGLRS
jgi:hypothetical protein